MVNAVFVIGTAGAGKTLLTLALQNYLQSETANVITVNLDPAVRNVPYRPDIDVRDYVDIERILIDNNLGPNGAMIAAVDVLASRMDDIKGEMEDFDPDGVIIDTPGQLELFAYRSSGPYITKLFLKDRACCCFLFDAFLASTAAGYVSLQALSTSVQIRLGLPIIHALSKMDLLEPENLLRILNWNEDIESLYNALEEEHGLARELSIRLAQSIEDMPTKFPFIPVSSLTTQGIAELCGQFSIIWTGGEDWRI
ncbi:MAG: ATP/GTP-binding protein [Candidatus Hermodarchaeota archaeon]